MNIELFLVPGDEQGNLIKSFLNKNSLKFDEIITEDLELLSKVTQRRLTRAISMIRIKRSHSIQVMEGYNEFVLNQLLEHISKYKPKIK